MFRVLSRELRSLGDVDVVDLGDLSVAVVAFESQSTTGVTLGYSASLTVLENIVRGGKICHNFPNGFLLTGGKNELRRITADMATNFDTQVLEKRRRASRP